MCSSVKQNLARKQARGTAVTVKRTGSQERHDLNSPRFASSNKLEFLSLFSAGKDQLDWREPTPLLPLFVFFLSFVQLEHHSLHKIDCLP
mmetsp:Transcript_1728/g.3557  ORF Transcript_1728/g.3557 Transcript_1728/m.3557 type:complete len:90 (-) Transcript_1728:1927-2196(-)